MLLPTFINKLVLIVISLRLVLSGNLLPINQRPICFPSHVPKDDSHCPCHIPYAVLPVKEPILTTINGELIQPTGPGISLNFCEQITLSCLGNGNNFKIAPNDGYVIAYCVGWLNFVFTKVDGEHDKKSIFKLECKDIVPVSSWKNQQNSSCGVDSKIYEIGHIIPPPLNKTQMLYKACYNETRHAVEFTSHTIHGSAINYSKKNFKRKAWKLLGVNNTIDDIWTDLNNKVKEQIGDKTAKKMFSKNIYLQKGSLSPASDFVFASSKRATLSDFNYFPQWNTINNGNWKAVEEAVRKKSVELDTKILVVTGIYGVLNLEGKDMTFPPHYSIPNYVWKMVFDLESAEAIGFVTSNNPFYDENFTLCKDICDEYGWKFPNRDVLEEGKTYCCTTLEIGNFIKPLYTNLKQYEILKGPENMSDL